MKALKGQREKRERPGPYMEAPRASSFELDEQNVRRDVSHITSVGNYQGVVSTLQVHDMATDLRRRRYYAAELG